jgi:hypothetical protein
VPTRQPGAGSSRTIARVGRGGGILRGEACNTTAVASGHPNGFTRPYGRAARRKDSRVLPTCRMRSTIGPAPLLPMPIICVAPAPSGNIPGNTPTRRRSPTGRRRPTQIGVDPRVSVQVDPGTSPPEAELRGANPLGRTPGSDVEARTVMDGAGFLRFRGSGAPVADQNPRPLLPAPDALDAVHPAESPGPEDGAGSGTIARGTDDLARALMAVGSGSVHGGDVPRSVITPCSQRKARDPTMAPP